MRISRSGRTSVDEYLSGPEWTRPAELAYGVLREPPAPYFVHQEIVTRLAALLDRHVRARDLGVVCVAPLDVVLDETAALVVQPDVVFISRDRLGIIRNQVWGAPDLVVEVASLGTAERDRTVKLGWYQRYGVREYWLIDPWLRQIELVSFTATASRSSFGEATIIRSAVLPRLRLRVARVFDVHDPADR